MTAVRDGVLGTLVAIVLALIRVSWRLDRRVSRLEGLDEERARSQRY